MSWYEITAEGGRCLGFYRGDTRTEALAAMHRDAGYDVTVAYDELFFARDGDDELCGTVADFHVLEAPYGVYCQSGRTYTATQNPWPFDADHYRANAIDDEGNEVRITWPIINHETEDGGESCDWDNFTVRTC